VTTKNDDCLFCQVVLVDDVIIPIVTTLALGLRPRQGLVRLRAKKEAQESCRMFLGVQESVRE